MHGDAAEPPADGPKIIAHVVNDKAQGWGGRGFAPHLGRHYPEAQAAYRAWAQEQNGLELGDLHLTGAGTSLWIASMVAQRGYGDPGRIRLRYGALEMGLNQLATEAEEREAKVHLPMIGTGQAGGDWGTIKELINASLLSRGIDVTVYVLPGAPLPEEREEQLALQV